MKIVVVGSVVRHRIHTETGDTIEGWGGSVEAAVSSLSCLLGPGDRVVPVARVGREDVSEYVGLQEATYGALFGAEGLVPDPKGTNFHDATWVGEGDRVHTNRQVEPVHFWDLFAAGGDDVRAVLYTSGEVVNYDDDLLPLVAGHWPWAHQHVDVHRSINAIDEESTFYNAGWPMWVHTLPWSDSVHMNRPECRSLLGIPLDTVDQAKDAARILLDGDVRNVAITLAADGCVYGSSLDKEIAHLPTFVTGVARDVTGAGDDFGTGLTVARVHGLSFQEAVRVGLAHAAFCCERLGYLTPGEVTYEQSVERAQRFGSG